LSAKKLQRQWLFSKETVLVEDKYYMKKTMSIPFLFGPEVPV
jgi:hypothetical protein